MGSIVGLDDLVKRLLLDVMLPAARGGWDVGGQEIMSKVRCKHQKLALITVFVS